MALRFTQFAQYNKHHQAAMFNKVYHIFKGYNNILKYVCKIFDNALPYTGILHVQCMFDESLDCSIINNYCLIFFFN